METYKKKYNNLVETIAMRETTIELCIVEYEYSLASPNIPEDIKNHRMSAIANWKDELSNIRAIIVDHKLQETKTYKEVKENCKWLFKM